MSNLVTVTTACTVNAVPGTSYGQRSFAVNDLLNPNTPADAAYIPFLEAAGYASVSGTVAPGGVTYTDAVSVMHVSPGELPYLRTSDTLVETSSGTIKLKQSDGSYMRLTPRATEGVYMPSNWGKTGGWATARAAAATRQVNVVSFGDSLFEGYDCSNLLTTGIWGRINNFLRTTYGDGGSGFHSIVDAPGAAFPSLSTIFTTTGGTWVANTTGGVNDVWITGPGAGATLEDDFVSGTIVDVIYNSGGSGLGGGPFSLTIDGVLIATIAQGGNMGIGRYTAAGLAPGVHRVVITQTTAGSPIIMGVVGRNATGICGWGMNRWGRATQGGTGSPLTDTAWFAGLPKATALWASLGNLLGYGSRETVDVVVTNGSKQSTSATMAFTAADVGKTYQYIVSSTTYTTTIDTVTNATTIQMHDAATVTSSGPTAGGVIAQAGHVSIPAANVPDLAIIELGVNDLTVPVTPAQFGANIRTITDMAKAANPLCDILYILPALGAHADTSAYYNQYAKEYMALASCYGAAFINVGAASKMSYPYWTGLGYWGDGLTDGAAGADTVHMSDAGAANLLSLITPVLSA